MNVERHYRETKLDDSSQNLHENESVARAVQRLQKVFGETEIKTFSDLSQREASQKMSAEFLENQKHTTARRGAYKILDVLQNTIDRTGYTAPHQHARKLTRRYFDKLATQDTNAAVAFSEAFLLRNEDAIENPAIFPAHIIGLLQDHKEWMDAERKKAQPEFEKVKEEFIDACDTAIDNGVIPLTKSEVRSRLSNVQFILLDPIVAGGGEHGIFSDAAIGINTHLSAEERRKTLFHEMMHAISANDYIQTDFQESSTDGTVVRVENNIKKRRSGLSFKTTTRQIKEAEQHMSKMHESEKSQQKASAAHNRHEVQKILLYINEAITENMSLYLLGSETSNIYVKERMLFQQLLDSGISWSEFLLPYFAKRSDPDYIAHMNVLFKKLTPIIKQIKTPKQ